MADPVADRTLRASHQGRVSWRGEGTPTFPAGTDSVRKLCSLQPPDVFSHRFYRSMSDFNFPPTTSPAMSTTTKMAKKM